MKVTIFGTGYVGLVTGVCLADLGHTVICVDTDEAKITSLQAGEVPIYEPGLETLLFKNHERLTFTNNTSLPVNSSDIIFIAVGTPQSESGEADLTYVESVARTIGEHIDGYKVVVVKSTVPVGTGDRIESLIRETYQGEFAVVSNPEFLKEGSAIKDFNIPDRIVIGTDDEKAFELMNLLYEKLEAPVLLTDRKSSELIKYASNAFLATKISFINSMANLASEVGADIESVAQGMGMDSRIGPHFLKAGIGYGGSCFPKDVTALIHTAKAQNVPFELLESVERVNEAQKEKPVTMLKARMGDLSGKTVGILGLSFMPETDDLREAPSLTIIQQLIDEGAQIKAWDPISEEACRKIFPDVFYCPSPYEAVEGADAVIVVTEWDEVKRLNLVKVKDLMKGSVIFDGRNVFDGEKVRELGFEYVGIGK